jgi:hypothetical protein
MNRGARQSSPRGDRRIPIGLIVAIAASAVAAFGLTFFVLSRLDSRPVVYLDYKAPEHAGTVDPATTATTDAALPLPSANARRTTQALLSPNSSPSEVTQVPSTLQPHQAELLHDGRILRLVFRGPKPPQRSGPAWTDSVRAGKTFTLSGNIPLECIGAYSSDWTLTQASDKSVPGSTTFPTNVFRYVQYAFRNLATGETQWSEPTYCIQWNGWGIGAIHFPNNKLFRPFFEKPVPPGWVADCYLSTDDQPNYEGMRLYKTVPAGSESFDIDTRVWANPNQAPNPDTLYWTAYFLITDPSRIVTWGQNALTVSGDAGFFADLHANTTAAAQAFPVANRSVMNGQGWVTDFPPATGPTIYISATGNDSNPGTLAAPVATLATAMQKVNAPGGRIYLRRGDTITGSAGFHVHLPVAARINTLANPLVIASYWHDYSQTNQPDPGTRPVLNGSLIMNDGTGAKCSGVIVKGIALGRADNTAAELMGGMTDVVFSDCLFGFGNQTKVGIGPNGNGQIPVADLTAHRCIFYRHTEQGIQGPRTPRLLISECTFADNGINFSTNPPTGSIYNHHIYLSTESQPPVIWGSFFHRPGNSCLSLRGGGVVAYCAFNRYPALGVIEYPGGGFYKCLAFGSADIEQGQVQGLGLGLGSWRWPHGSDGYYFIGNIVARSTSQTADPNNSGRPPQAVSIVKARGDWDDGQYTSGSCPRSVLIENNTLINHAVAFANYLENLDPAQFPLRRAWTGGPVIIRYNILDGLGNAFYDLGATPFDDYAFLDASHNALSTSVPAQATRLAGQPKNLAFWQSLTGDDPNAITTTPQYASTPADLGTYYQANGGTNDTNALAAFLATRPPAAWMPWFSMQACYETIRPAYRSTNLQPTSLQGSTTPHHLGAAIYRKVRRQIALKVGNHLVPIASHVIVP